MSRRTINVDRLLDLTEEACDETASLNELAELDTLLLADQQSRDEYLEYYRMHVALRLQLRSCRAAQRVHQQMNIESAVLVSGDSGIEMVEMPSAAPFGFVSTALPASLSSLSSGWPVAYLIATVIFGIGALVGSFIYVSHPEQVAKQSTSLPSHLSTLPSVVGRITGMADCKWKERTGDRGQGIGNGIQDSPPSPLSSPLIHLGDKFALASGRMEVTYDTGAKVILQGPCTYRVESAAGGYLSDGKLTARVEKTAEGGGRKAEELASGQWSVAGKSEIENLKSEMVDSLPSAFRLPPSSNPSLSPLPSPLFTVRTPTAIVTDLGTEFGVDVDKDGRTTSYVFRGAVSIHAINGDKDTENDATILHANESAHTERAADGDQRTVVRRVAIEPSVFVRQIESSSPVDVLAWFRMGEDEPNARAGEPAGKEIRDHSKKHVRLDRHGSPTYSADTELPGSVFSMTFHGGNDGDYFHTSRFPFVPNDYFILEAWVKLHKLRSGNQVVIASGRGAQGGYCLAVVDGRWYGVLEAVGWIDSGVACEIGKWTHLALVCERGKSQLRINGMPVGKAIDTLPIMPDGRFTIGGSPESSQRAFNGEIDEVRLSTFIGPFRPEMLQLRKADLPQ
jgi:hypothetical protein